MNIVLVGMMGSGKSAVGRTLASMLGRPFVDTDAEIEARSGRPIPAIFAAEGEAAFRALEAAVIAEVAGRDGQVIATGGGAVVNPANRAALRASGLVFWLDAPPAVLLERAAAQGLAGRPLLAGPDPLGRLTALAAQRAAAYAEAAHHRVETAGLGVEAVAGSIAAKVKEAERRGAGQG